jgi:hypothetical protein
VKQIFLLLIVVTAISCTKENLSDSVVGDWTIIQRKTGTGYSLETSAILSQKILHFNANGTFQIVDADTTGFLQHYSSYQIHNGHITFFSPDKNDTADVEFILNDDLSLYYPARCGYVEIFSRK